jgi:hypothetical protein
MSLKYMLCDIQTYCANLEHARLLKWCSTPPLWHINAAGGVHLIMSIPFVTLEAERNSGIDQLLLGGVQQRQELNANAKPNAETWSIINEPTT